MLPELPSQELKETLIKEALLQSSFPLSQYKSKIDLSPHIPYFINKDIQCYSIEKEVNSQVNNTVSEFSFDYLLSFRFAVNGQKVFLPNDTTYFSYQITHYKPYQLTGFSDSLIKLIDKTEIRKLVLTNMETQKTRKIFRFNILTLGTPLFNAARNLAIIGIEEWGYSEQVNSMSGTFYVLRKKGNNWILVNTVPWKDKN